MIILGFKIKNYEQSNLRGTTITRYYKVRTSWTGRVEQGNYWRFCGLRAKMYSLKTKKEEMKKAMGVKKNVVKKGISHQDYVDCLFEERKFMHTM